MTNELCAQIKINLEKVLNNVYRSKADEDAMYPHAVFSITGPTPDNDWSSKKVYELIIDVYTKDDEPRANELMDEIIEIFSYLYDESNEVLASYFFKNAQPIIDEDKTINHKQIKYEIESYRGGN